MARLMENLRPVPAPSQSRSGKADDRLHELYWNRAQLKKEFAALRKERFKLLDALTEEEGRSARLRQKLEFLEDVLADPDTANNAVVFYTLRKLWSRCGQRLVALSAELRSQREAHATKQMRAEFLAQRHATVQKIAQQIDGLQQDIDGVEQQVDALGRQIDEAGGFLSVMRRRRLQAELDSTRERHAALRAEQQALDDAKAVEAARKVPDFEKLDIEVRRAINCTVIAFAELLATHYRECELNDWLRIAQEKSVGSARFGDPAECQRMLKKISQYQQAFESRERAKGFSTELAELAREIRTSAKFPGDDVAVPDADSLYAFGNNVLARDMWHVSQAMLL
ncbi:MAG: hypothetical protein AAGC71_06725 [Pseudomonadota bacterium]